MLETLYDRSPDNGSLVSEFISSLKIEMNLSSGHRWNFVFLLCKLSKYSGYKSYKELSREDILAFLNSLRKNEASDPPHTWIGTYNLYKIMLVRLFKWLYFPDIESKNRPNPEVI